VDDNVAVTWPNSVSTDVTTNDIAGTFALTQDTVSITSGPTAGSAVVIGPNNHTIQYTPGNSWHGTDSLVYSLCDPSSACSTATVHFTGVGLPTIVDDTATTAFGQSVVIDVLANDTAWTPPFGAIGPVGVAGTGYDGTTTHVGNVAIIDGGTRLQYTPHVGFAGQDTFQYFVCNNGATGDPPGHCGSATVTVTVNPLPPPTAVDDSATTNYQTSTSIPVLNNDSAGSGGVLNPASVAVTTGPTHGAAVAHLDGTVSYTPANGFSGTDTFTYSVGNLLPNAWQVTNGVVYDQRATATVTVVVAAAPPVTTTTTTTTAPLTTTTVAPTTNSTTPPTANGTPPTSPPSSRAQLPWTGANTLMLVGLGSGALLLGLLIWWLTRRDQQRHLLGGKS
jgi:hypothetical protein